MIDLFLLFIQAGRLLLLTVSVNDQDHENIEVVPMKAQAGYAGSHADPEYIASLPKFNLPFLSKNKTHRCFQIKGDSMPPIEEGSWVTASYVQNWNDVKDGESYIVVTKDEGIMFKRLYNHLKDKQAFTLVSTNSLYAPFEMMTDQILELWKFETWNGFNF